MTNFIATTMAEYLTEHITNDVIWLKKYLSATEAEIKQYLPEEFPYFFDDFLYDTGIEFEKPKESRRSNYQGEPDEEVDMFDGDDSELMVWLSNNDRGVYKAYAEYLYDKISSNDLHIPDNELPAWVYFDNKPSIIKNQWLVHFTEDADDIAEKGFIYGVDDMTKLGLTTNLGKFYKQYGGYNFAYTLNDFKKYAKRSYIHGGGYKYGSEVVMFRSSGIRTWHNGDEEYQVIFFGKTATNIIPIGSGEDKEWGVRSKSGRILFEDDDLEKVVYWVDANYQQYRKSLDYK